MVAIFSGGGGGGGGELRCLFGMKNWKRQQMTRGIHLHRHKKMKRKQAVHFDGDVTLEYVAAVRSLSLSSVFCSSLIDRSRPCWTMTAGVVVPRTRQSCHVMHTSTQVGPGAGFNMKTIFLRIGFPIIKRRSW